jgi:FAD/FMN-containing dehydrogenase
MEAEPRVLDLTGDELPRVSHAFGTNGIITEVEMPLAPAYDWTELLVAFDDFTDAATFARDVANEDGILIKLATCLRGTDREDATSSASHPMWRRARTSSSCWSRHIPSKG